MVHVQKLDQGRGAIMDKKMMKVTMANFISILILGVLFLGSTVQVGAETMNVKLFNHATRILRRPIRKEE